MRHFGLILGLVLFAISYFTPAPAGMSEAAWLTAGIGLLMAAWWATEAVPVPVTSLLPIVLFPLLGQASIREITTPYAHPVIFLLLGGFIIATALERWHLHRRLALNVLKRVGSHPQCHYCWFYGDHRIFVYVDQQYCNHDYDDPYCLVYCPGTQRQ